LSKVMFPDDGFTKAELLLYYQTLTPVLLPHLRGQYWPAVLDRTKKQLQIYLSWRLLMVLTGGREVAMVVNPISESAYLKGLCLCTDPRDCWHGPCKVRRQLRFGMVVLDTAGFQP